MALGDNIHFLPERERLRSRRSPDVYSLSLFSHLQRCLLSSYVVHFKRERARALLRFFARSLDMDGLNHRKKIFYDFSPCDHRFFFVDSFHRFSSSLKGALHSSQNIETLKKHFAFFVLWKKSCFVVVRL